MSRTQRQQILALLEAGPTSVSVLAEQVRLKITEVAEHLEHIRRSLQERGQKLELSPARCTECDMVFKDRRRFTAPSRCPRCRSERTTEPILTITGSRPA